MQIAKSRRTLRINLGAGPEGRKEDLREIGKSKRRATAAALAAFNLFDGPLAPLDYFWKPGLSDGGSDASTASMKNTNSRRATRGLSLLFGQFRAKGSRNPEI